MRKLLAPMATPLAIGSALAVGLFSLPSALFAQEAKLVAVSEPNEAEQHVAAAQAAFDGGFYPFALENLEEAYRLTGRGDVLQALREAHQNEGDREVAALALRCYPTNLTQPPECAVPSSNDVVAVDGTSVPTAEPTAPEPTASEPTASEPIAEPRTTEPRDQTGITVAWILSGVGAATILGATAVGFSAEGTQSSLDDRCGPMHTMCPTGFQADRDRGVTLSLVADVLGISGAAILGTGIALLFLFQEEEAPPVTAACGPEGCMATLRGSF